MTQSPIETSRAMLKTPSNSKGFYLNVRVKVFGHVGFSSGFCKGGVSVRGLGGNYITEAGKKYRQ